MKILVHINSMIELDNVLSRDIDGIIVGIDRLSVNTNFSLNVNELKDLISKTDKEIFVNLNKIIHNKDIEYLSDILSELRNLEVRIIFYDFAVLNIAKRLGIISKLVVGQNHLNNSIMSNNYYNDLGINYSILSSEITLESILEIKNKTSMNVMINSYGYVPMFYSRRYLIKSYLDYTNKDIKDDIFYLKHDNGNIYPIYEEEEGTTIYNNEILNLIDEYKIFEDNKIDYLILNGLNIPWEEFDKVIDNYLDVRKGKIVDNSNNYKGFLYTKTIYKVKE